MSNVARFPPLPPVQEPFSGPFDPRQATYYRIMNNLTGQLIKDDGEVVETKDSVTGYRASAVDVGHIQEMLEAGLRQFTMDDIRQRWKDDLFMWCVKVLRGWIQRRKHLQFALEDTGIHVTMTTQDDHGYYHYEFDVFPGKKRGAR